MKCVKPEIEANSYARTVATFMAHKPLEDLLRDAFQSGYKCCLVKNDIEEKKPVDFDNQLKLFEWNKAV